MGEAVAVKVTVVVTTITKAEVTVAVITTKAGTITKVTMVVIKAVLTAVLHVMVTNTVGVEAVGTTETVGMANTSEVDVAVATITEVKKTKSHSPQEIST